MTRDNANWDMELGEQAWRVICGIVESSGLKLNDVEECAIASTIADVIDRAYTVGVCIGAVSKERQVKLSCHRGQN